MDSPARNFASGILNAPQPPGLSLYQTTYRSRPDNAQDPIRFGRTSKSDVVDSDAGKFSRAVDRAVTERHSQPSGCRRCCRPHCPRMKACSTA